MALRSCH